MRSLLFTSLLAVLFTGTPALRVAAQTGVSDDRVSLPDGPGSTEGLGDNVASSGNQGAVSHSVPILIPDGYAGLTPSVGLNYSSTMGTGVAGMGWSFDVPSIERLTLRGLPDYDADDEFAVMGSAQLVRVSSGSNAVYRARFEGGFVRYTFHDAGSEGYWEAEYPDGTRAFFGADAAGTLVPSARLSGDEGTFRYLLVEHVDLYGHRVHHTYDVIDGSPYAAAISYGPPHLGGDRYRIEMVYGARPEQISDCKPGFEEKITQRLVAIRVLVRGIVVRRYALVYEDTEVAGGLSRLVRVERYGRDGGLHPVVFDFSYARALGADACGGPQCEPHVVDMGTVPGGVTFHTGSTTLADLNGDALPDLVDTSRLGEPHRIFFSRMGAGDSTTFAPAVASAVANQSAFDVKQTNVQVLDVNGDGFTDLVNLRTSSALCNLGTGDWVVDPRCAVGGAENLIPVATSTDADPTHFRFVDIDSDRRIDLIHTPSDASTLVYRNTEDGFVQMPGADAIGRTFDVDRLFLSDINADGLLDVLQLGDSGVPSYRLNLGRGRWSPAFTAMDGPEIGSGDLERVVFEDLNSDGRDDMILVLTNEVRYALNRNGQRFDANAMEAGGGPVWGVISMSDVPALPIRGADTTMLFADMNGNGTRDIVWIERTGQAKYLELFATPPNLLSRVENGLGAVQDIVYGTSVGERRRSEQAGNDPWTHVTPMPMTVVKRIDLWERLTGGEEGAGLHDITEFEYEDSHYDGVEKQFRGFVEVNAVMHADDVGDTQERGRRRERYDVGATDPYFAGRLLETHTWSGAAEAERAIAASTTSYSDCPVADVPSTGLLFDVRHVCATESTQTSMEGRSEAEWRTSRSTMTYDAYGNVTESAHTGFIDVEGDESFMESEYIAPGASTGDRWILGRASRTSRYGSDASLRTEERTFYDGPDFVGLEAGLLTLGAVTRVTRRVATSSDGVIQALRRRLDAHGNVVEEITPRGSIADPGEHRHRFVFDDDGFRLRALEIPMRTPEGEAYVLRRERAYEESFDQVSGATDWTVVQDGQSVTARHATAITYDEFTERTARFLPGDPSDAPTITYLREYGSPVTAIRSLTRTARGAAPDVERIDCVDGKGRLVQSRHRISGDTFQVSGFSVYNSRGVPVRVYQPYRATGAACEMSEPATGRFTTRRFDAMGRLLTATAPDADEHGGAASVMRVEYFPDGREVYDPEDNDRDGAFFDTPTRTYVDGRGLATRVERELEAGAPIVTQRAEYDALGRLTAIVDQEGNRKEQRYDLLGRVLAVDDPNAGPVTFEHDDAGNLVRRTDAREVAMRFRFDSLDRLVSQWDEADEAGTAVNTRWDFGGDCAAERCTNTAGRQVEISYATPAVVQARLGGAATSGEAFGYSSRGELVYAARTIGSIAGVTRATYDNGGRLLTTTHPDGREVTAQYDGVGRMASHSGFLTQATFTDTGALERATYTNGASDAWAYDARLQPVGLTTATESGSLLQDLDVTYNRMGHVVGLSDTASSDGWDALAVTMTHDAWYRVTEIRGQRSDLVDALSFGYDLLGNFTHLGETVDGEASTSEVAFDGPAPNAVTRVGDVDYHYDASGDLTQRGELTFEWDHLHRLTQVTQGDQVLLSLGYGAGQAPLAVAEGGGLTLHLSDDFEIRDGVAVSYDRLAGMRAARHESTAMMATWLGDPDGDGAVRASDAWALHMARSGGATTATDSRVALRGAARRQLAEHGDDHVLLHHDHLGDLVAATDASGAERGRRRFALVTGRDVSVGYVDRYGLSGQEHFDDLGLVRHGHRWLDMASRRWTQPDPAFLRALDGGGGSGFQGLNPYGYVDGTYGSTGDPTGLEAAGGKKGKEARGAHRASMPRPGHVAGAIKNLGERGMDTERGGFVSEERAALHRQMSMSSIGSNASDHTATSQESTLAEPGGTRELTPTSTALETHESGGALWSGHGQGGDVVAAGLARAENRATLEIRVERGRIRMPEFDRAEPSSVEAWRVASARYAESLSGDVVVYLGAAVSATSIYVTIERPAIAANPNVTSVTEVRIPAGGGEPVRTTFTRVDGGPLTNGDTPLTPP